MSHFWFGNILLISSICFGAASQVMFKMIFNEVGPLRMNSAMFEQISNARIMLMLLIAAAMLVVGFILWISSLSRLDLSYAYPVACGSALLVVGLSAMILGEPVTLKMWLGTALVVLGTGLLVPSR